MDLNEIDQRRQDVELAEIRHRIEKLEKFIEASHTDLGEIMQKILTAMSILNKRIDTIETVHVLSRNLQ